MLNNNIYNKLKENMYLLITFVPTFILLRVSPMMYDGWAGPSYYAKYGGLVMWIKYVFVDMRNWINGRVASNLVAGILEYYSSEILLDLIGTVVCVAIVYCLVEMFDIKNKNVASIIFTMLFIFSPISIRTYVIQIALLQYVTPIFYIMIAILLIRNYEIKGTKVYAYALYVVSIFASMWMENSSIAYGVIIVACCIDYTINKKKLDFLLLGIIPTSLICGIYMITSNGTKMSRSIVPESNSFFKLGLENIINHFKVMSDTFIIDGALSLCIIFALFSLCYFIMILDTKSIHRKKYVTYFIMFILNTIILLFGIALANKINLFSNSIEYIDYGVIYSQKVSFFAILTYILLICINFFILLPLNKLNLYLLIYGLISLGTVLFIGTTGSRIYSPFYFITICMLSLLISNIFYMSGSRGKKILTSFIIIGIILSVDYQASLCKRIFEVEQERNYKINLIKDEQYLNGFNKYKVYELPSFSKRDVYLGGITNIGTFHYPQFLERYGLNRETKIAFSNYDTREYMDYVLNDKNELEVSIVNSNLGNKVKYYVNYRTDLNHEYIVLKESENLVTDLYKINMNDKIGDYKIFAEIINNPYGIGYKLSQEIFVHIE